jgi:putative transposase
VYHVLNRGAKRTRLFDSSSDYSAFENILCEAQARTAMRLLAYCIMPNHWHFVLWPDSASQMSQFMHWLTLTHAQRWQVFHQTVGCGPVYQGRYKAIPVQTETQFLNVCRYVERNPLRAGLVLHAQEWQWSSLWRRHHGPHDALDKWPVPQPGNWTAIVDEPDQDQELDRIRLAVTRGAPLGDPQWVKQTAGALGLDSCLRPRGRPKKARKGFPDPLY